MAQNALPIIDPAVDSGTDLSAYLNAWFPAVNSTNAGATRPAYATAGTFWINTTDPAALQLMVYDGTQDVLIGTINPVAGTYTPGGLQGVYLPIAGGDMTGALTVGGDPVATQTELAASEARSLPLTGGTLTGPLTVTGKMTATGDVEGFSDVRLKDNFRPIENALAALETITGYIYRRKDLDRDQAGIVADDLQRVLPVAVGDCDGIKTVSMGGVIALLINAVNELKNEVRKNDASK